jgi:hypothetical protein
MNTPRDFKGWRMVWTEHYPYKGTLFQIDCWQHKNFSPIYALHKMVDGERVQIKLLNNFDERHEAIRNASDDDGAG